MSNINKTPPIGWIRPTSRTPRARIRKEQWQAHPTVTSGRKSARRVRRFGGWEDNRARRGRWGGKWSPWRQGHSGDVAPWWLLSRVHVQNRGPAECILIRSLRQEPWKTLELWKHFYILHFTCGVVRESSRKRPQQHLRSQVQPLQEKLMKMSGPLHYIAQSLCGTVVILQFLCLTRTYFIL